MSPLHDRSNRYPGAPIDAPYGPNAVGRTDALGRTGPTPADTSNPLLSNLGPAAYADRQDEPDLTVHGTARIVPLRVATDFWIDPRDPDDRGIEVRGVDGARGGVVVDIWVDRAEPQVRYFEVETVGGRRVLLPVTNVRQHRSGSHLGVKSITGAQFAEVPGTRNPDIVTLLEEDKIMAYYAGGYLFAHPTSREPLV
jgi:photosynthetic reaction center H subunit